MVVAGAVCVVLTVLMATTCPLAVYHSVLDQPTAKQYHQLSK